MPISGGELARLLVNYAKAYREKMQNRGAVMNAHMNKYRGEFPSQDLVDAIVVDFINFTMGHGCGMDLALYTSDIQPEVKKEDGDSERDRG